MKIGCFRRKHIRHAEAGQAMLWTIVGLGVFLLGSMARPLRVALPRAQPSIALRLLLRLLRARMPT
jgi:hypothetical protein